MNNIVLRNGNLIFQKRIIPSFDKIEVEIQKTLTFQRQLLILYKNFYKLRTLIDQGNNYNQIHYINILKRRFRYIDYNVKREKILNLPKLSESELIKRIFNSLIFTFNSTVSKLDEFPEIVTFTDIEKYDNRTLEGKVIHTFLTIELRTPNEIKYDFKFNWYNDFTEEIKIVEEFNKQNAKKKKKEKVKKSKYPLSYVGYKQYELSVMNLNESYEMCF